ncbi:MAG: alpha-L-fucosidase [Planctomycetota bacterium]|nr:alpha-L-fucosidase [Planctomycetota bacterium]
MLFFTRVLLAVASLCLAAAVSSAETAPAAGAEAYLKGKPEDVRKWREMRFGLFIHWGPVSLKGTEIGWSRGGERRGTGGGKGPIPVEVYDNLYKEFNPTKFDAREWVAIAKAAGMKYLVFTTKHHDGFCEFDSSLTDYKIANSPFKRDVVKELAGACHEAGLALGWYYSPPDWHHPDYRTANHARYVEYLHGQLRELCTNYGKVDIIWFDGLGGSAKDWDAANLFKMLRELQPHIILNNRAGLPADWDTPEQTIGKFQTHRPWETCMTICQQWAWQPNDRMKSLKECIQTLVKCAGGDGNLLFNVGPMPTGEIEPRQVERLKEMGQWLAKNGASIYATNGGPFRPGAWGCSTYKDSTIYVHVLNWQGDSVTLPAIQKKIVSSSLLTGGAAQVKQSDEGIEISVPQADRPEIDTIVVLNLDGPAAEANPSKTASASLAKGKKATASNVFQKMADYLPDKALDDDEDTRWATDAGTHQAWLEVDLGQPAAIGQVMVKEYEKRVKKFELQYKDGDQWKTFLSGTTIGSNFTKTFDPVTAQVVRFNILEATEGPSIWEFQLYAPKK